MLVFSYIPQHRTSKMPYSVPKMKICLSQARKSLKYKFVGGYVKATIQVKCWTKIIIFFSIPSWLENFYFCIMLIYFILSKIYALFINTKLY